MMLHATDLLVAVQGDTGDAAPVVYKPPKAGAFRWEGSSIGAESGGLQPQADGSLLKVTHLPVQGPTAELAKNGVTELERLAVVTVSGREWSIDQDQSHYGPSMTRLLLFRRPIAQHHDNTAATER